MLVTMTAVADNGHETHFEQRMEVPAHGFLDVAASLNRTGMRTCLHKHLKAGQLRSAMHRVQSYALPRLMIAIADKDTTPHSTTFKLGEVNVGISLSA